MVFLPMTSLIKSWSWSRHKSPLYCKLGFAERPNPNKSMANTWKSALNSVIFLRQWSVEAPKPCTNSKGGRWACDSPAWT